MPNPDQDFFNSRGAGFGTFSRVDDHPHSHLPVCGGAVYRGIKRTHLQTEWFDIHAPLGRKPVGGSCPQIHHDGMSAVHRPAPGVAETANA